MFTNLGAFYLLPHIGSQHQLRENKCEIEEKTEQAKIKWKRNEACYMNNLDKEVFQIYVVEVERE